MPTLVTPSAKSHERVTGRWMRDTHADNRKEWTIYYIKLVVGSPIPFILALLAFAFFTSRYALEFGAWSIAILTCIYIAADRFTLQKEFKFFTVGADVFLIAYLILNLASLFFSNELTSYVEGLGALRWVPLLYAFSYCWELFPGLNRIFAAIYVAAVLAVLYAAWQHFSGIEVFHSDSPLEPALTKAIPYFTVTGFFRSPEVFGTMLALLIPGPVVVFLLASSRDNSFLRWGALVLSLLLAVGVFWTYRPGIWIAGLSGIIVTLLLVESKPWMFIFLFVGFFAFLIPLTYDNPDAFFQQLSDKEMVRADRQRAEINENLKVFEQNNWTGGGVKIESHRTSDIALGNTYFQILSETGIFGLTFYLLFILGFLLANFRVLQEIPNTHFWHRVLMISAMASQVAFHAAGLYWSTIREAFTLYIFAFILASLAYLSEHYGRGLVPDDQSL